MTKDLQACTTSDSIRRAAKLIAERHVGSIPVIADEQSRKLLGVVTDRDIVLRAVAARRDPNGTAVAAIMTTDLITCRPSDRADEAVDWMMMHQIRRIYVVDQNGALVGVIAQADVASRYGDRQKTAQMIERVSQPEADRFPGTDSRRVRAGCSDFRRRANSTGLCVGDDRKAGAEVTCIHSIELTGSTILAALAAMERQFGFLLLEGAWALISAWSLVALARSG